MTSPSFDRKRGDEMGGKKAAGIFLLVVGIVVLLLSLFADLVGLWGGAVMAVVGLELILRNGLLALASTWIAAIRGGVRAD
jgi:predicted phage tail protein